MYYVSVSSNKIIPLFVLLTLFTLSIFSFSSFGQDNINKVTAPPFALSNLNGGTSSLESFYTNVRAVAIFFIKANTATQEQGLILARFLENEYRDKWMRIPAKILIVANGDPNIIKQATGGITVPILQGTDAIFNDYGVVTSYALYVLRIEQGTGLITAMFDAPADIQSDKVNTAMQACAASKYIIKASFDDGSEKNVFKKPDGSLLTSSEIFPSGKISYEFTEDKRAGGSGKGIKIVFPGSIKGSLGIDLSVTDLNQAGYLSMWILGGEGAERFYIAIGDKNGVENQVLVNDYIGIQKTRWQCVSIPIRHFNDRRKARSVTGVPALSEIDFKAVSIISLRFDPSFGGSTVYLDDLSFYEGSPAEQTSGTTSDQGAAVNGEISIAIIEAPKSGVYPGKGLIKGIVKGINPGDIDKYRVVIFSQTDQYYIQPLVDNPYTSIRPNGGWSANIYLANVSYAALLVKKTGNSWPLWDSPVGVIPSSVDGVEIIDTNEVEPGTKQSK